MSDLVKDSNYSVKCEHLLQDSEKYLDMDKYYDASDKCYDNRSDDSGYITERGDQEQHIDKDLQLQNQKLNSDNLYLKKQNLLQTKQLEKMKNRICALERELTEKETRILELSRPVEYDMEKLLSRFNENLRKDRELCSKMHNYKMKVMEKNLDKLTENKIISDRVATLKSNLNVGIIKNGELNTLLHIGNYFAEIEKFEENIQPKIFLEHNDNHMIDLLGGKKTIENLSLEEIKTKVLEQTHEINSVERLIHLHSIIWTGKDDPLIFKQNLNRTYKMYNHDNKLELNFEQVLGKCITGNMKKEIKNIFEDMLKQDAGNAMEQICNRYNYKKKEYFFNESICFKTGHRKSGTTKDEDNFSESICLKTGHHSRDHSRIRKVTPYQGRKKSVGEFLCINCNHKWISHNSWSNCSQQCRHCKSETFPYKQRPLDKPGDLDVLDRSKVHLKNLCGKCKTLGYCCKYTNNR